MHSGSTKQPPIRISCSGAPRTLLPLPPSLDFGWLPCHNNSPHLGQGSADSLSFAVSRFPPFLCSHFCPFLRASANQRTTNCTFSEAALAAALILSPPLLPSLGVSRTSPPRRLEEGRNNQASRSCCLTAHFRHASPWLTSLSPSTNLIHTSVYQRRRLAASRVCR